MIDSQTGPVWGGGGYTTNDADTVSLSIHIIIPDTKQQPGRY
jgi:hypothetical protein